jgi:hypothetical protein
MIASGAGVKIVQQQLGHASATLTLDRYAHLFPDELDALSSALDGLKADSRGLFADCRPIDRRGGHHNLTPDLRKRLWGGQDLNLRPTDYESAALTD